MRMGPIFDVNQELPQHKDVTLTSKGLREAASVLWMLMNRELAKAGIKLANQAPWDVEQFEWAAQRVVNAAMHDTVLHPLTSMKSIEEEVRALRARAGEAAAEVPPALESYRAEHEAFHGPEPVAPVYVEQPLSDRLWSPLDMNPDVFV